MLLFHILAVVLILVTGNAAPAASREAAFCPADLPFEVPEGTAVNFGYLEVPENRSDPESRWIEVAVAILVSRSPSPAPDPLIHIIGGPGSSHLTSAKFTKAIPYLDERDVVLFEQRGTRFGRPCLTCPEMDDAARVNAETGVEAGEALARRIEAAKACRDRLHGMGVDLDGYRTTEIAADVEDFRRLMGYGRVNLLAVSYGTKVAQVLVREHPTTIRSVILDSVLPLEVAYEEKWLGHRRAALDRVFAACESDPNCAEHYPDLASRFWSKIDALVERPRRSDITKPVPDGDVELNAGLALALLDTGNTSVIPTLPMLADAIVREDLAILGPYLAPPTMYGSSFALAMRMACWCADEVAFVDPERVALAILSSGMPGQSPYVVEPAICRVLAISPASSVENEPVFADLPVLLVSGGVDSLTPVAWARALQARWPRAKLIEFPLWGHAPSTNWNNPCAQALISAFLSNPEGELDDPCLESVERVDFVTP